MRRIFVCSRLRGESAAAQHANVARAKILCLRVIFEGHAPFASHLMYPIFLDDDNELERQQGIAAGLAWIEAAHEVWVDADDLKGCSEGMRYEIEYASKYALGAKIVYRPAAWRDIQNA